MIEQRTILPRKLGDTVVYKDAIYKIVAISKRTGSLTIQPFDMILFRITGEPVVVMPYDLTN